MAKIKTLMGGDAQVSINGGLVRNIGPGVRVRAYHADGAGYWEGVVIGLKGKYVEIAADAQVIFHGGAARRVSCQETVYPPANGQPVDLGAGVAYTNFIKVVQ